MMIFFIIPCLYFLIIFLGMNFFRNATYDMKKNKRDDEFNHIIRNGQLVLKYDFIHKYEIPKEKVDKLLKEVEQKILNPINDLAKRRAY